jgi:glutaredoxin-like YruB-family protein
VADEPKVTIYTTVWCGFCKMAKSYMDHLGIKYIEKDVEKDQAAGMEAVEKSGQMGVPVIDVGGTIILGFNRPMLDEAFKAHKLTS